MPASTATDPNSSSRSIELGWDTGPAGLRRLVAECGDSITTMLLIGPALFDESDPRSLLAGRLGSLAIAEHVGRCEGCQTWQERAS